MRVSDIISNTISIYIVSDMCIGYHIDAYATITSTERCHQQIPLVSDVIVVRVRVVRVEGASIG